MASNKTPGSYLSRETAYCVVAVILVLAILIITLIQKWHRKRQLAEPVHEEETAVRRRVPEPVVREDLPTGARHRQARRRMQIERDSDEESPAAGQRQRGGDDDDDDEAEEDIFDKIAMPEGKVGAKKLRKLQEKAEKRSMREQMEREREERKEQAVVMEEKRKKDEAKQKREEAAQEEEERIRKEEEARQEHEEYLKMKEEFTIDEEGEQENLDLNSESLLEQFINYIKELKVIMLEDLAIHFQIKTQDAIDRIHTLMHEGKLTGVMDDRGKFIYITREEMEAVAKYIRQRGRISVSDLAKSSNALINLNPDNELAQRRLLTGLST